MKKAVLFLLAVLFISGCSLMGPTFEEVSAPYYQTYGEPEGVTGYKTSTNHTIKWWWYTQGYQVTFQKIRSP